MHRMGLAALAALGLSAAVPAEAATYGFSIGNFTEGAVLSFSFDGEDADGDGILIGTFPTDCGCGPSEITSFSVAFTGNALIPAFSYAATDIAGGLGTLSFVAGFNSLDLYYVIDPNGSGALADGLPPGTQAGDADILFSASFEGGQVLAAGSACGSPLGGRYFGDSGVCAGLNHEVFDVSFAFDTATVPEPAGLALLGTGLGLLAAMRRRRLTDAS